MAGFDIEKLLPLYLDEADELIVSLNDALLRLEQAPDDAKSLQEAFRYVHTIKGSSTLLGLDQVKDLTHQLETIFDQLRAKKRLRPTPRCSSSFFAVSTACATITRRFAAPGHRAWISPV